MSDETIYMGNTQNEDLNESEHKSVIANVWKPITIGGFTGILLGAGALMASNASAANQDQEDASQDDVISSTDKPAEDLMAQMAAPNDLDIANIEPGLSFEEAFISAREQVGPGGIFYWHGAIFSTYTADEWNEMTEDEQARFAMQVQPEVDANHVDTEQIAAIDAEPAEAEDAEQIAAVDAEPAEAVDAEQIATVDAEPAEAVDAEQIAAVDEEPAEAVDAEQFAAVEAEPAEADDVEQIAAVDNQAVEDTPLTAMPVDNIALDMDIAMADVVPQEIVGDVDVESDMVVDEDVQIADLQPDNFIEDLMLASASTKSMNSMNAKAQQQNIAHEFGSDDDVRIVGYGEYDGHIVTGLDLDGDNQADIAVIDVDDSGNYSRPDIVIDNEGNMSTFGELEDFALEQMPGEDNDQLNEAQAQNPEVAQDMPDYMDDALAQL